MPNSPCVQCGSLKNSPDSKFCVDCGQALLSCVLCPACGENQNPAGSKFCKGCGASLVASASAQAWEISAAPKTFQARTTVHPGAKKGSIIGKIFFLLIAAGIVVAVFFPEWLPGPKKTPSYELKLGAVRKIGTQTLPSGGGSVSFRENAGELSGLALEVPASAYDEDREISLSWQTIENKDIGKYVHAVSPLIGMEIHTRRGEDEAPMAGDILRLRVPAKIPEDHAVLGFYYDETSKKLEAIPVVDRDADGVTLATRHFSKIFLSSLPRAELEKKISSGIDSDFRPGTDDWSFPNYGTCVEPGGHCAGQSAGMIWYYMNQKIANRKASLFHGMDNNKMIREQSGVKTNATPKFWQDDNLGQRMATCVQQDIRWDDMQFKIAKSLRGLNDRLTWECFAYAILVTGLPQYIGINTERGLGHAMVAYQVKGEKLFVCDPNYPGEERFIHFDAAYSGSGKYDRNKDGRFDPYESKANVKGQTLKFPRIGYLAVGAILDMNQVGRRWQDVEAGTIGDDLFPKYQLKAIGSRGIYDLTDGFESESERLIIRCSDLTDRMEYPIQCYAWTEQGPDKVDNPFSLARGNNVLGVKVMQTVDGVDEYVDFRWFNVVFGAETPSGDLLWEKGWDDVFRKWSKYQVDPKTKRQNGQIFLYIDEACTKLYAKGGRKNDANYGEFVFYFDDDGVNVERRESYDEKGKLHGTKTVYDKTTGKAIRVDDGYVHGELDGKITEFYQDGKIYRVLRYSKGLQHGLSESWWENGRKASEENWNNGQMLDRKEWDSKGNPLRVR